MTNHDKIIVKIFFKNNTINKVRTGKLIKSCPNITDYLLNRFYWIKDKGYISEILWRLKLNDLEIHCCEYCGKPVFYRKVDKEHNKLIYSHYCSKECQNKGMGHKISNTKLNWTSEQLKHFNESSKATKLERHGDPYYCNYEQVKSTKFDRYGDEYYTNREQAEITTKLRYGTKYYAQTKEFLIKQDETKRKNCSRKEISKQEKNLLKILEDRLGKENVISQYRDPRYQNYDKQYQYKCDFYIPKLDMFIEFNGYYTHNFKPFDETNIDDLIELEYFKERGDRQNVIDTWTKFDVRKRNCAKQNKLNYIELWNYKDALKFVNTITI